MSRTFDIPRDPHECGMEIYSKDHITINPGLTILVGCNGSGKTTLLRLIKERLKGLDIPVFSYDNLCDGGHNARQWALDVSGDMDLLVKLALSSEGEQIYINFGRICAKLGTFVRRNADKNELWILLDAVDSGLSIDYIVEIKDFLTDQVVGGNPDKDIYVLISANEYEMCCTENCFDIYNGVYTSFEDYEEYREFILRSRERTDKRGVF